MAQSVLFKECLEDRTEATKTRAKTKTVNDHDDYDSNEQRKSIKSCSFATTEAATTTNDTKLLNATINYQSLLSLASLSGSMVPALINLARLPLTGFWPITCSLGNLLAWIAQLTSYYFIGWRSTRESRSSAKMESVCETNNLQRDRRSQVNEKVADDIYTTIELASTNKQQLEAAAAAAVSIETENNVSPMKVASEKLDINQSSEHFASNESPEQQQVVADLLSERVISEALEGALKMSCTQPVAVEQATPMSEAAAGKQTIQDQNSSSESINEPIECQPREDEEEEDKEENDGEGPIQEFNPAEPQLSTIHELERPRTSSEVDRYSDQLAQIFVSLAGIDEDNDEALRKRATEAIDSEAVDGDDSLLDGPRMTTASDIVDAAANQDDREESSIPNTIKQTTGGKSLQEETTVAGDRGPSSASSEDLSLPGDLDESGRPTNKREQSSDIGQSSLVADGRTTRQEGVSRPSMDDQSAEDGLQNSADSCVTNLEHKHEAGLGDEQAQVDESKTNQISAASSSADSNFSDNSSAEELPEELSCLRKEEEPSSSGEEGSCCVSECVCDHDDSREEFCGETASNSTLRRLKMNTFEDVLVCEQNRQSLAAARRLFDRLALGADDPSKQPAQVSGGPDRSASGKWGGSLSSAEEPEEESDDTGYDLDRSTRMANKGRNCATLSDSNSDQADDSNSLKGFDTIKIVRRSGSSASSSNFRQTLVCSVSPTSQLDGGSNLDVSNLDTNQHPIYPIDGDEIIQCRAAFRENKRLIEEQQERAKNIITSERDCSSPGNKTRSPLTDASDQAASSTRNFRSQRDLTYLDQTIQQSKCSRCHQRVYPVDKMELDFTRATLNIHRNCFKCQICSTLLRLETYAALDAKLYCPSHIKCVMPSR